MRRNPSRVCTRVPRSSPWPQGPREARGLISAALPSPLPAPSRRAGSGLSRPVTLLGQRTPFPTRLSLGCGAQDRRGWHGGVSGVWGFSLGLLPQGSMGGPAEPGSHAMCVSGRGPPRPPDLSDDAPPPSAGPRSCLPVHPPLGTPRVLHDPVGYPVLLSVPDSQDRVVYFIRSFMTGSAGNGDTGRRLHPEGSAPPRPPPKALTGSCVWWGVACGGRPCVALTEG